MSFQVSVKETDLWVQAEKNLECETRELVLKYRAHIESYIHENPEFLSSLKPWRIKGIAPKIVCDMALAGQLAGVGPMAAVAGAVAEYVGLELLGSSSQVVVENGGDIFLKTERPIVSAIYAGASPLSLKIGISLKHSGAPIGICTSSGTVGHSYSMGKADAVCVVSNSCALSDAAATAICNHVDSAGAIGRAIAFGKQISGVSGIVVISDDKIGMWGDIEIVPLTY
ncbi:MAG: UPF0280 family protein [Desulfobacterales bacterium]|nr:UPF0280 family protein [Desulfobacterales bacterium]